jgi:hypothetical protein
VRNKPEGREHKLESGYWAKRSNMMYYQYVDFLVRKLAADAKSLIDIGSANAQYIEDFDWIPKRNTLDIKKPYSSENVAGIQMDFFDFQPVEKYDFATCLQVLEHIPDARSFARKLFEVADHVLISVPYRWEKGSHPQHVHDPVDESKLFEWTGREPSYSIVVEEPLSGSRKGRRLICYYHPGGERLRFAKTRKSVGSTPAAQDDTSSRAKFRLFGSEVSPVAYLFAAATEGARLHFGQSAEDAILLRLFGGKMEGFYVDLGAYHPRRYSNTFILHHFFKWGGVNVDASAEAIALFEQERPGDTNVHAAIGPVTDEEIVYWKFDYPARNTISEDNVRRQLHKNNTRVVGKEPVRTRTLAEILAEHLPKDQIIDFLNIDIEGADLQALVTNDWENYRPRVIAIEDYAVKASGLENSEIYLYLREKGYKFSSHVFDTSIYTEEDFLVQGEETSSVSPTKKRAEINFRGSSLKEVPKVYDRAEALVKSHPETQRLRQELQAKLLKRELTARRKRNENLSRKVEKREAELKKMREKHREALRERERFRRLYLEIERSRWWRYTRPLRKLANIVRSGASRRGV